MDSFFEQSESKQEVVTNQKKKRKLDEKKDDTDELKQKAKLYCSCTEQWKIINKYNVDKLKTWVDEREFEQTKRLHETVFSFVQRAIAFGLDTVTFGDDHVSKEIQDDVSLRQALEVEAGNWLAFLSNRFKILALLSADVANGKLKQKQENKSMITIIEQTNGSHDPVEPMPRTEEEVASGEVPGDIGEAVDMHPECSEKFGQDNGSCEPLV